MTLDAVGPDQPPFGRDHDRLVTHGRTSSLSRALRLELAGHRRWAQEAAIAMRSPNDVLISFFDSNRAALHGLRVITRSPDGHARRPRAVVVSRGADGSRPSVRAPASPPLGAVLGAALGAVLGSLSGGDGVVVGLFFGLYVGISVDAWRILGRHDLLDQVQDGLAPGEAALVAFVRGASAASIERSLDTTDAVTVRRSPSRPIERDLAREVQEAVTALERCIADGAGDDDPDDRQRCVERARRRVAVLESMAGRLLSQEQLQYGFEARLLDRERRGSPRWRGGWLDRRATCARAAHRRTMTMLEASHARLRAADATVVAPRGRPAPGQPVTA